MSRCTGEARCSSERAGPAPGARRTTVLVVDDDAFVREAILLALQLEGYATLQAVDGLDALLSLRTGGPLPDVIVLDLEMPVMAGWEFRAAQLAEPTLARIPVVVVSSSPRVVDAARRLRKPFAVEELLGAIREVAGEP